MAELGDLHESAEPPAIRHELDGTSDFGVCHIQITERCVHGNDGPETVQSQPSGSTFSPSTRTSKCRWQPVEAPVEPTRAMASPRSTT